MQQGVFVARVVAAAGMVVLVMGCGGSAATGDLGKIQVAVSQFEVTVTNTSGGSLSDVVAEIKPIGPASHFTARVGTVSSNEKRSVGYGGFSDRDGVQFSLRTAKPARVIVSGTGVDGKPVRVEVPFKI